MNIYIYNIYIECGVRWLKVAAELLLVVDDLLMRSGMKLTKIDWGRRPIHELGLDFSTVEGVSQPT